MENTIKTVFIPNYALETFIVFTRDYMSINNNILTHNLPNATQ